ncbi:MAG: glycosyltransferase family 2 protein [Nitrospinae bacterium]|nr:glycosyltransferase family 2 protein [Nitrospinota bacterium]
MKISIIIPAYNSQKTIGQAIAACRAIEWADKEVIVVDDGSTDRTAEIAQSSGVRVIRQKNGGPAAARNTGWKAATGEICFFTDADCLPHPDFLTRVAPHFADATVGGVGGTYGIANPHSLLARLIHGEILHRHSAMRGAVDYLGSFNCSYRRSVLEQAGGFDERFKTASAEDNDLSYRVRDAGHRLVFEPSAAVDHFHEELAPQYLRRQYNHGVWRVLLYRLHRGRMKGDKYAGLADLIQPPLALLLTACSPLLFFAAARPIVWAITAVYLFTLSARPVNAAVKTASAEPLMFIPVLFLRGFARGLGLARGVMKFGM